MRAAVGSDVLGVAKITPKAAPSSSKLTSEASAALKYISPGKYSTTNSGELSNCFQYDFFDKAKLQGGTYATIIPPGVWNGAMDVLKAATKAGDRVADAVQKAIDHISSKIGDGWDKEKFRKEYEAKLKKVADKGEEKTEED